VSGWVKLHKQIDESDLMDMPPVCREMFFYFIRKVNHVDNPRNGLARGTGIFTYKQIQSDLSWYVGFRKECYSDKQITKGLRRLREGQMIETTKVVRGFLCKVLKYNDFQDRENNEGLHEGGTEGIHDGGTKVPTKQKKYKKLLVNNKNNKSACAHPPASNLKEDQPSLSQFIHLVISDLNFLLDKNFNPYASETSRLISERLEERWTIEQFYEVHRRWIIRLYGEEGFTGIRPDTLYNQDFEKRLNFEVTFSNNKVFLAWNKEQQKELADLTKQPEWGEPWTWYGTEQKRKLFKAMIKSYSDWRNTLDSLQERLESTCA